MFAHHSKLYLDLKTCQYSFRLQVASVQPILVYTHIVVGLALVDNCTFIIRCQAGG